MVFESGHLGSCCWSVTKSCPTLVNAMNCSKPVLPCASLFSQSLLKLMSIRLVMPSNQLILCCHLRLPSIFSSIRVFSSESVLCIRWLKYWSFSISPSNEYSELISFRIDWLDLLVVQGISRVFSSITIQSINSLALSLPYGPTLTSVNDYWKNQSFDFMTFVGIVMSPFLYAI